MKKFHRIITGVLIVALLCVIAVFAEGDSYSSADDPPVTYSYVTQILKAQIKQEILSELEDSDLSSGGGSMSAYEVVYATQGQQIIAGDACEIILRAGSAKAVSSFAEQGLSDVTSGGELLNGNSLAINHYVLIPRGDGRGVEVTTNSAYFMIRGEYTIVG